MQKNNVIFIVRVLSCAGRAPDNATEYFAGNVLDSEAIPRAKEWIETWGKENRETIVIEVTPLGKNSRPIRIWEWNPPTESETDYSGIENMIS